MLCTPVQAVGPQFFRNLVLIVLGLATLGGLAGPGFYEWPGRLMLGAALLAFGGSIVWTLGRRQAGIAISGLLLVLLGWNMASSASSAFGSPGGFLWIASAAASSLLLGSVTAAMLLGHSYLVSPTMAIDPLKRLVAIVGCSLVTRVVLAGAGLLGLTTSLGNGSAPRFDTMSWSLLAARWVIGLLGPAIIAWMAWQTTKIRSTQSATGILYAGVSLTYLGEVTGQLLSAQSGFAL
jgi:hypothetical protein